MDAFINLNFVELGTLLFGLGCFVAAITFFLKIGNSLTKNFSWLVKKDRNFL